jgi:hypothetical protein
MIGSGKTATAIQKRRTGYRVESLRDVQPLQRIL